MFLDDIDLKTLDPDNMLGHIDALPDQLENAWNHAKTLKLPAEYADVRQIVICGMGGSAISGDLLAALLQEASRIPIHVHRDYGLPSYVTGRDTLSLASSY